MPLACPAALLENTVATCVDTQADFDHSAVTPSPSPLYILQQISDVSTPQTPDDVDFCPNHVGSARFVTDEEDADYYLIPATDTIDQNTSSDQSRQDTLFKLFSQPVDGQNSQARYLRCPNSQLEDCTAWYSQQQHHPIVVSDVQLGVNARSIPILTDQQKSLCQNQLDAAFGPWSKKERRVAWMTLCCAANSFCDLKRPELIAMVRIGMQITTNTAELIPDNNQFVNLVDSSINNLSQIMHLRNSGEMVFRHALMKNFIRQLNIPDIQEGHSIMTRICFQQIRQWGAALMIQPWYRFRSWFHSLSEWPLIPYVVRNWFLHYRKTSDYAEMNLEFYHLLKEALLDEMPNQPSMLLERRIVDAGYDLSQIYHLPGLEAVFRNMGALTTSTTNSVLGRVPTESQWAQMKRIPPPDYQTWMRGHSLSDEKSVEIDEASMSDFIVVHLKDLDLSSDAIGDDANELEPCRPASSLPPIGISFGTTNMNEISSDVDWVKVTKVDTEMTDES